MKTPSRAEPLRLWDRPIGRNRIRLRVRPPGLNRFGFGIVLKCEACPAKPSGYRPAVSRKSLPRGRARQGPCSSLAKWPSVTSAPLALPTLATYLSQVTFRNFGLTFFGAKLPPFDSRPEVSRTKLSCLTRGQPFPAIPAFGGLRESDFPPFLNRENTRPG